MSENIYTLRNELAENHKKKLESIVNDNSDKDNYYIFVVAKPHVLYKGAIKTTYLLMSKVPEKMLGTMLYHVDNKKGQLKRLWVIPRDIVRPESTVDYDNFDDNIFESAKRLPIIN